jgi:hypothetical protein
LAEVGVRLVQVHDAGGGRARVRVPSRSIQIRLDPQVVLILYVVYWSWSIEVLF